MTNQVDPKAIPPPREGTFLGHPIGLLVLFFAEAWERFSYYGMRSILVFYMVKQLLLPGHSEHVAGHGIFVLLYGAGNGEGTQAFSSHIYGLYTALVYGTPLLGGWLADRFLGQRKSVFIGGAIMAAGEFVLMSEELFYLGLLLLIVGNGFFKPNISTQVGALYPPGDSRRDAAFNIFYVGINIGAAFSPLICGTLGEVYGFKWGFCSAGVGMIVGIVAYGFGQRYLAADQVMIKKVLEKPEGLARSGHVEHSETSFANSGVTVAASGERKPFTSDERLRIFALISLCALNIPFWAVYEQQGNTLALWADGNTDRHVLAFIGSNWEMPASWFQMVNPVFIFLFTLWINPLWAWQKKRGTEPSSAAKMAIGCFLLAASFLIMIGGARSYASGGLASSWWLVGCTAILTVGEIYLSPVGLSLVSKISPPRIVSFMMGMWCLSSLFGNYLTGYLGTFWEKWSKETFFLVMSGLSLSTGLAFVALYRPLRRAIGDENKV